MKLRDVRTCVIVYATKSIVLQELCTFEDYRVSLSSNTSKINGRYAALINRSNFPNDKVKQKIQTTVKCVL